MSRYHIEWGNKGNCYREERLPDISGIEEVQRSFDPIFSRLEEQISSIENWNVMEEDGRFWNKHYPGLSVLNDVDDGSINFKFAGADIPFPKTEEFKKKVNLLLDQLMVREEEVLLDMAKRTQIFKNKFLLERMDRERTAQEEYFKKTEEKVLSLQTDSPKKKSWFERFFGWITRRY